MSIEEVYKAIQEAFVDCWEALEQARREFHKRFMQLIEDCKPVQYIPPKHRQMRYCWNKSRNWKRGWQ